MFGGGGVRNARLWAELLKIFDPIPVRQMDDCGSSSQAFEAQAFAVLAYQTVHGVCANVPLVTGARHPVILGSVTPGPHGLFIKDGAYDCVSFPYCKPADVLNVTKWIVLSFFDPISSRRRLLVAMDLASSVTQGGRTQCGFEL